jgi:hypothetical protein
MKMPSGLVIADRKLTHYLLVYQPEDDKSGFLALAGYRLQNWQQLKRDILTAVEGAEVHETVSTNWGTRYKVRSQWTGVNGVVLRGMTVWQQDEENDVIRLLTLYPDKSIRV